MERRESVRRLTISLLLLIVIGAVGAPYTSAVTMEERVAAALASSNSKSIEEKLKHMPDGTTGKDKVLAHLIDVRKQEAAAQKLDAEKRATAAKKQAKAQAGNAVANRRKYAALLREKFLDDGMDIKVSVSGATAKRLNLKFALFNDVWVHKFRKGGLSNDIKVMGFTEVDFNNGYDYHVALKYK